MVTARFLTEKFLEPLRERLREEGREEGRKEVRRWAAWNQRREAAEKEGEPFDEPPPYSEENQETPIKD